MDIKIRVAALKDLGDIQNLNYQLCKKEKEDYDSNINEYYSKSKKSTRYFRQKIVGGNNFAFVAVDGERIVGYLVGGLVKPDDYLKLCRLVEAENMFVLKEYRSQGIGKMLMKEMFDWCRSLKIERIRVVASFQNIRGIDFYRREGFKEYNLVLEKDL
ncbi:MAG: GNAT family N-acetyltransferase [Candidatus Pacearchaeota archaeon]|jgi:GNAT superfamily N-acetyltransferase